MSACSSANGSPGSCASCCARLRAAVIGFRMSCATRATSSPIAASFSAWARERSTADGAREQLGAVQEEGHLLRRRIDAAVVLVGEARAEDARRREGVAPVAPRADHRNHDRHVGFDQRLAQLAWQHAEAGDAERAGGKVLRCARPRPAERLHVEGPVDDGLPVGEEDGRAAELERVRDGRERPPAALDDAQLGRERLQRRVQLGPSVPAPAEHQPVDGRVDRQTARRDEEDDGEHEPELGQAAGLGVGDRAREHATAQVAGADQHDRRQRRREGAERVDRVPDDDRHGEDQAGERVEGVGGEARGRRLAVDRECHRARPRERGQHVPRADAREPEGGRQRVGRPEIGEPACARPPGRSPCEAADVAHRERAHAEEVHSEEREEARRAPRGQVEAAEVGEDEEHADDAREAVVDGEPAVARWVGPERPDEGEVSRYAEECDDPAVDEREDDAAREVLLAAQMGGEEGRERPERVVPGDERAEDEEDSVGARVRPARRHEAPDAPAGGAPEESGDGLHAADHELEGRGVGHGREGAGSSMSTVKPAPGGLAAAIRPPCASTVRLAMASPRPVPVAFRE